MAGWWGEFEKLGDGHGFTRAFAIYFLHLIVCMHVCLCVSALECRYLQRPEDGIRPHRAGVTESYKPPTEGSEHKTQVFCKSSIHS